MLTRASRTEDSVKLPFLSLIRRTDCGSAPVHCSNEREYALAFTTSLDAGAYLRKDRSPELELKLISRHNLSRFLDELEAAGFAGIAFDARPDGTVDSCLPLEQLRLDFAQ